MNREVRVRFAPSPTGALHIGGVRTALYNFLFARKNNGKMILRIEDTDQTRFVPGAEEYIFKALKSVGITIDEGVQEGGAFAPYRQSERKPMYMEYALQMVKDGNAYYAFDTEEELDKMREELKSAKVASPQYNSITRVRMKNSLTLPEDEVQKRLSSGQPYVIRLKVPRKEEIRLNDLVRGWVVWHSSTLDDKVLMKSDGMPTYHLANVVDDHLMNISHVIRGEEWLPSAPTHLLIYRYLGWENTMPQFAHLPLLLKPDGNGKLSKRDAEKHGFPIFPMEWKDPFGSEISSGFLTDGYLPDALVNFLAFLGWNPGTQQEIFSMDELIQAFSIERIGKSGTKFDINKAQWFNQQYLKAKSSEELSQYLQADLIKNHVAFNPEKLLLICEQLKERINFPQDLYKDGRFFFIAPEEYDQQVIASKWNAENMELLAKIKDRLASSIVSNAEEVKSLINQVLEENQAKIGKILQVLRVCITGLGSGPDMMKVIEILGVPESVARLENALIRIPPLVTK
jgi:glutamyl-tRNA synthetase